MTSQKNSELSNTYHFNGLTLSTQKRELTGPHGLVSVEKKVLDLLVFLVENRHRAVSKSEIQDAIWPETIVTETALTRAVMKARRAVADSAEKQDVIRTLHGEGYRFVAPLEEPVRTLPPPPEPVPAPQPSMRSAIMTAAILASIFAVSLVVIMQDDAPEAPVATATSQPMETVAVLPFDNLSPDPNHAYFAEGIQEEILNHISRDTGIRVLARAAVKQYAGSDASVSRIAEELGVDTLLTGSIRYASDRVRVSTQLIEGKTGISLWSNTYDRDFNDIFTIQSDVATRVATALNSQIRHETVPEVSEARANAYREYLLARSFRARTFETGWGPVLEHTDKALALDPAFIPALWIKHNAYQNRIIGDSNADAHEKMLAVTRRAVASDPGHALTLALVAKDAAYEWRWQDSLSAWEKAIAADDTNPTALGNAAFVNIVTGNVVRAEQILAQAISANPQHDWPHYANLHLQLALGDEKAFIETAELIMSIGSNRAFPTAFTMALYHAARGETEAITPYGEVLTTMTGGALAPVVQMIRNVSDGGTLDPELMRQYGAANPPSNNYRWMAAQMYLLAGSPDHAMEVLWEIAASRSLFSVFRVTTDPAFSPLWDRPDYQEFLKAVNLHGIRH